MSGPAQTIVFTGTGIVTSLGTDVASSWEAVCAGRCGIGPSRMLEQVPSPDKGSGDAPDLPHDFWPGEPREVRCLRWAIDQAVASAALSADGNGWPYAPHRCGLLLGTTLHGMRAAGRFLRDDNTEPLKAFLAASTLARAARGLPATGNAMTTCAACASGLVSLAMAVTMLETGQLDLVIAGGYDPVSEYAYGGFNSLRLVAQGPQRPFSKHRQGLKLSEGYGIVVIERESEARQRGATILGRVLACSGSADAHHLSQPHPEGLGAAKAMDDALTQAGLTPDAVGLIVAHATATPDNDRAEFLALQHVFGDFLRGVPVTAFKSHLGHTLGGAGSVELILTLQALRHGVAPPLANVQAEEIEFEGLPVVTGSPGATTSNIALINSLGFGGSNACLVLESAHDAPVEKNFSVLSAENLRKDRTSLEDAVITGVGVVFPGAVGNNTFCRLMSERSGAAIRDDTGVVDEQQVVALLNTRRVRRMSEYVKLSLAATTLACRDAGIDAIDEYHGRCAAISGTAHGSARFSEDYYRQIVNGGLELANPLLFAEGVPNAGSAHLSMMLGLKGPCQTLIGSRTAGLDALHLAARRICSGAWDCVIVGGAEEFAPLINRAYSHCGLYAGQDAAAPFSEGGFAAGAGAVSLIVERRASASARGAPILARVEAGGQAAWAAEDPADATAAVAAMLREVGLGAAAISSANGTWLDRVERLAVQQASDTADGPVVLTSMAGHVAECFSAIPLAGLAAALLTRRVPRLCGVPVGLPAGLQAATGDEPTDSLSILASDYNGVTTAVRWRIEPGVAHGL